MPPSRLCPYRIALDYTSLHRRLTSSCRAASYGISRIPLARFYSANAADPSGTKQHSPVKRLGPPLRHLENDVRRVTRPVFPLQSQLSPDELHQRLAKALKSPSSALRDVKANLQLLRPWLVALSPEKRYAEASKYHSGAKTLNWLWANQLHTSNEVLLDFDFMADLALLLVAERMDRFVNDWIFVHLSEDDTAALGKTALTWRAALWRALIMAELTFAGNRSICLDAAISRLFKIQTRRQELTDGSSVGNMSPWPAVIAIVSTIGVADCSSTSVRLYEDFTKFTEGCQRSKRPPQVSTCRLHLWHPTRPDAQPFVRLLKGDDGGLGVQQFLASFDNPSTQRLLKKLLHRAQLLLRRDDPNGDLDWLQQAQRECEEAYAREWRRTPERRYRTGLKYHKEIEE